MSIESLTLRLSVLDTGDRRWRTADSGVVHGLGEPDFRELEPEVDWLERIDRLQQAD